jgi:hypothetical protein
MVYLIYGFAGLFIVLSCAMLYAYYRGRNFGLFIIGVTYGTSGVLAIALPHWWPIVAGFVLVWLLKLLGLEPSHEPARDEGGGMRDEGKQDK